MVNVAMATWPGNRIVLNRNRAHKLQKRGEWIRWNAEKQYWEWTPCAAWERHFVCPMCGSRHWGSSSVKRPVFDSLGKGQTWEFIDLGGCHGPGCDFSWAREDDDDFFKWHRKPPQTLFNIKRIKT